jgi:hypothetical protein
MKTAVEWLHEQFKAGFNYNIEEGYEKRRDELFEEAKEMEKEQIMNAFDECGMWQDNYSDSEHYYNKTFKSEQ